MLVMRERERESGYCEGLGVNVTGIAMWIMCSRKYPLFAKLQYDISIYYAFVKESHIVLTNDDLLSKKAITSDSPADSLPVLFCSIPFSVADRIETS